MMQRQVVDPIAQARELWQQVVYRKWIVLFSSILLCAISLIVISLLPDYYVATTSVLVDPQQIPDRYVTATVTTDPTQRLNTITQEVLSATRLQQIIDMLKLYPELRNVWSQEEIIDYMRKNITIQVKQGSEHNMSAFIISYTGKDPNVVAQVANQLASSFIEWNLSVREQQATGTTEFLNSQLQDAKKALAEQDAKISDFKMKHLGEMPEQLQANTQNVARLQVSLQANADALNRLEQEKLLLTQAPESAAPIASAPVGVSSERTQLQAEQNALITRLADLRARYTEDHPDVAETKRRLQEVEHQLKNLGPEKAVNATNSSPSAPPPSPNALRLQIIDREMKRLQQQQAQLEAQINRYQSKMDATPLREQQLADLSRDYANSKDHYQSLMDKSFAADMAMDLERKQKAERFTILDPARIPEKPVKPNRLLLIAILLPVCFLLPAGAVIGVDRFHGTINSERELRSLLRDAPALLCRVPFIETPEYASGQRRLARISVMGILACCVVVAAVVWKIRPRI